MSITLEKIQGLIAGDGELPVQLAENAKKNGFQVIAISLSSDNRNDLKKHCEKVYSFGPGEIGKIREALVAENVKQLTFIGKVHKGLVLKRPKFDSRAIELLKQAKRLNDDAVMMLAVQELESVGITVLDQTLFIKNLMVPTGVLGKTRPSESQIEDVNYGFWLAKEMGKVDVGQSVVIKDKMVMAVEAIEGTDKCIERGAKYAKKGAVIVKVAKPSQDKRFDIPAFGLRTLKMMKKCGANLIAVEAGETIIVDQQKTIEFADKNNIVVMAV
ncbi:MAG: UDP-2,3-diacylglucosamine diphosphatase LpxI [Candidatus Gastranaerophilales bacterium]|nr:UDP-2,3-diacylglucosamine diphosphatase LpxI [Candidatus Gastranaerophilales bacterium]